MSFFYTYVLQSIKDGDLYTGYTKNLQKRFEEHSPCEKNSKGILSCFQQDISQGKKGKVFSTKSRRPLKLIYYEACLNEDDARCREKSLKTFRGKMTLRRRLKSFFTGKPKQNVKFFNQN
jgi:putative endonuclease